MRRPVWSIVVAVVLMATCLILLARLQILNLRIVFAGDQLDIFRQCVADSQGADAGKVKELLEYCEGYYPSGTKQVAGSTLDLMVEKARAETIQRLSVMLEEPGDK